MAFNWDAFVVAEKKAGINLRKEVRQVQKIILTKGGPAALKASVYGVFDVSGSAESLYTRPVANGDSAMQIAITKVLPIALLIDDDGSLPTYFFNSGNNFSEGVTLTKDNHPGYITRDVINNREINKWGGTDFQPVLYKLLEDAGFFSSGFMTGKKLQKHGKSKTPTVIYMFTDGDNTDESNTTRLLEDMEKASTQAYVMFVGVGTGTTFRFCRSAANKFSNVGFAHIADLATTAQNSKEMYDILIPQEMVDWLK